MVVCSQPTEPTFYVVSDEIPSDQASDMTCPCVCWTLNDIVPTRMRIGRVQRTEKMKLRLISAAFAIWLLPAAGNAQVTVDMDALTCGQYLAMSPSMSRDFSAWISGWFSYQTRRTSVDVIAHQKNIASLKMWCELRPQESVMAAMQNAIGSQ